MRKIKSVQLVAFLLCIALSATACGSPTSSGTDNLVKQAMEFSNGKYYTTDNFLPFYCWEYPSQFAKERREILNLFAEIDSGDDEWSSNPEVIKVKSKIGVNHDFIEYIVSDSRQLVPFWSVDAGAGVRFLNDTGIRIGFLDVSYLPLNTLLGC